MGVKVDNKHLYDYLPKSVETSYDHIMELKSENR